ncbi:tripartite tricarboxylate transporter substrate binding protein [Sediminicoccus sp. KRV36]|uniref:Bug family tripartite tricarboxylate transporter substrate binding protein n=1 Tax=Sediminicoccus sp. KRV36 TaxID=3133721 RepID=UPI00200BB426|nr:tripartite tricarboxylate transporter substrate binding protein [Sediminicoccus rosea]UPY37381.1 tripartite tricarboxylate transporter substrate binding protein [Sediminicoccus rosea]
MNATRRAALAAGLAAPAPFMTAAAQERPVRFIVPYPPGGPTDLVARVTAAGLQPALVENRPGAGGSIGAGEVARAAPDGSTFLVNASAHVIVPHLQRNMPFDSLADFTPITEIVKVPLILVVNDAVPARDVAELIALARSQPGRLSYASSSIGGAPHLAGELFKLMTRTEMVHVPYRGSGPALQDLLGGTVQVMFDSLASSAGHIRAGRLRALAVTTTARLPGHPELPTVAETVPGYEISTWYGMWAPPRLPPALATRMQQAVARVLATPEAQARFLAMGAEPVASTPEAFSRFLREEYDRFGRLIRDADIKGE